MPLKPFFRKFDGWWYIQLRQGHKRFAKKLEVITLRNHSTRRCE